MANGELAPTPPPTPGPPSLPGFPAAATARGATRRIHLVPHGGISGPTHAATGCHYVYWPQSAGSTGSEQPKHLNTFKQIRADGDGPLVGLMREVRIRWILFRRAHRPAAWQLLLLGAALVAAMIGVAAFTTYRSDSALAGQLSQLQQQTISLQGQVSAQRQELAASGSQGWQKELARAAGLSGRGESVYVIESAARAAGPGPAVSAIQRAAQVVDQLDAAATAAA